MTEERFKEIVREEGIINPLLVDELWEERPKDIELIEDKVREHANGLFLSPCLGGSVKKKFKDITYSQWRSLSAKEAADWIINGAAVPIPDNLEKQIRRSVSEQWAIEKETNPEELDWDAQITTPPRKTRMVKMRFKKETGGQQPKSRTARREEKMIT